MDLGASYWVPSLAAPVVYLHSLLCHGIVYRKVSVVQGDWGRLWHTCGSQKGIRAVFGPPLQFGVRTLAQHSNELLRMRFVSACTAEATRFQMISWGRFLWVQGCLVLRRGELWGDVCVSLSSSAMPYPSLNRGPTFLSISHIPHVMWQENHLPVFNDQWCSSGYTTHADKSLRKPTYMKTWYFQEDMSLLSERKEYCHSSLYWAGHICRHFRAADP